jgi:hypothetical protein
VYRYDGMTITDFKNKEGQNNFYSQYLNRLDNLPVPYLKPARQSLRSHKCVQLISRSEYIFRQVANKVGNFFLCAIFLKSIMTSDWKSHIDFSGMCYLMSQKSAFFILTELYLVISLHFL